ncbi:hypothetical protein K8R30_03305 [archaeon]|nr:hypothetical protein [archaeon]
MIKNGELSLRKVIVFVLAIVVLIILFGAITGGLNPLIEKLKEQWEDTIYFISSFGEDFDLENCNEFKISDIGGGEEFLNKLRIPDATLGICPGFCNLSWTGVGYRLNRGILEKIDITGWKECRALIDGDIDSSELHWEIYHKGVTLLEDAETRKLYDEGQTRRFVLSGDGSGPWDKPTTATWANGQWVVSVDGEEGEIFTDNDEAIAKFLEGVNDMWDDEVFWKIEEPESPDETYLKGSFLGSEIGNMLLSDKRIGADFYFSSDKIYKALMASEHGTNYNYRTDRFTWSYTPWIRTKVHGSTSTAYGPVQITKGLVQSHLKNEVVDWTPEEEKFLGRYIEQGWRFLAHGDRKDAGTVDPSVVTKNPLTYANLKISTGTEYDPLYDYGGAGELTSDADKAMYKQMAIKMIEEINLRRKGNVDEVWREWRFGAGGMHEEDERYEKRFNLVLNFLRDEKMKEDGTKKGLDNDKNILRLKKAIIEIQTKLLEEATLPEEIFDRLNSVPQEVEIDGKTFNVNVEKPNDKPVLVLESNGEKYGLKYSGTGRAFSNLEFWIDGSFRKVKIRYFPVSLAKWIDEEWVGVGDKNAYQLYENHFREVFVASIVKELLQEKCR